MRNRPASPHEDPQEFTQVSTEADRSRSFTSTATISTSCPPATPLVHHWPLSMNPDLSGSKHALCQGMPIMTGPSWSSRTSPRALVAHRYPVIVPLVLRTLHTAKPDDPVSSGGYCPGHGSTFVASL